MLNKVELTSSVMEVVAMSPTSTNSYIP